MKFRYHFIVLLLVFFSSILRAGTAAVQLPDGFVIFEEYGNKTGEIRLEYYNKSKKEITREYKTNSRTGKNITGVSVRFAKNKIYVEYTIAFKGKTYKGIIQLTSDFKELLHEEYTEDEFGKVATRPPYSYYDLSRAKYNEYSAFVGRFRFRVEGSFQWKQEHPKRPKYDVSVRRSSLTKDSLSGYQPDWNIVLPGESITDMEILYADSNRLLLLGRNIMSETVSEDILYLINSANGEIFFKSNMNNYSANGFSVAKGIYNPVEKRIYLAGTTFDKTEKKKRAFLESLSMIQLNEKGNLMKDEPVQLPDLKPERSSGSTDKFGISVNNLFPDGNNGFVMLISHYRGYLEGMSNLHYYLYGFTRYELNEKMEVKSVKFVLANKKETGLLYMKIVFTTPDGKYLVFSGLDPESKLEYKNVPHLVSFDGNGEIKKLPESTEKFQTEWTEGKNMFWSENNKTLYFLSSEKNKLPINAYPLN